MGWPIYTSNNFWIYDHRKIEEAIPGCCFMPQIWMLVCESPLSMRLAYPWNVLPTEVLSVSSLYIFKRSPDSVWAILFSFPCSGFALFFFYFLGSTALRMTTRFKCICLYLYAYTTLPNSPLGNYPRDMP